MHYHNEIDEYAASWLRNLIAAKLLPAGVVDTRSITEVQPDDLRGFTQCHFFAGIGGWSLAARIAQWPDDRELWTGSCPCQPFSVAGKGAGQADERHLWPEQFRLIRARRPAVWMGEQVAAAVGRHWLDGVLADLEGIDYAGRAVVVPACAVDAPHRRDRAWIVADRDLGQRNESVEQIRARRNASIYCGEVVADDRGDRVETGIPTSSRGVGLTAKPTEFDDGRINSFWRGAALLKGTDGKTRRVKPGVRLLAHGVPGRVGQLRAYGNAIVPQVAAEVIAAYMECKP